MFEKQVEVARARVQLHSPPATPLPSLPSEKGTEDGFVFDRGFETDGLGRDTDGPGSAVEEAGRDAALGLSGYYGRLCGGIGYGTS